MSFLFFKQKTAYELRISDWSSDVCSSDLAHAGPVVGDAARRAQRLAVAQQGRRPVGGGVELVLAGGVAADQRGRGGAGVGGGVAEEVVQVGAAGMAVVDDGVVGGGVAPVALHLELGHRSAERRGGKECVGTC